MNASAHRANARDALRGHWVAAVVVALIGTFFGVSTSYNIDFNINAATQEQSGIVVSEALQMILHDWLGFMMSTVVIIAVIIAIVQTLLGGAIRLGICQYNLNLIDRKEALIDDILAGFPLFWKAFLLQLIPTLLAIPASILAVLSAAVFPLMILLVPVYVLVMIVVVDYGFAMAPYILLEDPECTAWQALTRSYNMMKGHKWELCCLGFSFIGWVMLCIITLGFGTILLSPYVHAANASFYRSLQNQGYAPDAEF